MNEFDEQRVASLTSIMEEYDFNNYDFFIKLNKILKGVIPIIRPKNSSEWLTFANSQYRRAIELCERNNFSSFLDVGCGRGFVPRIANLKGCQYSLGIERVSIR